MEPSQTRRAALFFILVQACILIAVGGSLSVALSHKDITDIELEATSARPGLTVMVGPSTTSLPALLTRPPTVAVTGVSAGSGLVTAAPEGTAALIMTTETSSDPDEPARYTVQAGDNLYRIALAYGVAVEELMAANGLDSPDLINAGQELIIPSGASETNVAVGEIALEPASPTPAPSETPIPTLTTTPTPTWTPTPLPTPTPVYLVNGLALSDFLWLPPEVQANAQAIFARGQELGRNPQAFSKVGDSTIENPHFLARFDEGVFNLGEYGYLQQVIDFYAGSHSREGMAVRRGLHSWTVNDPAWADKSVCLANESPIACEIRLNNPSLIFIRLGSNDRGVPEGFKQNLGKLIQYCLDNGVLPILGTKADRFEGSNINNEMIRQAAIDFRVPLWDFDRVASTVPGRGLDVDNVHLTVYYAHDYTSPVAFQRGHGVHNLTALMVLDAIWRQLGLADQP